MSGDACRHGPGPSSGRVRVGGRSRFRLPELELYGLASERIEATYLYGDPRWFAYELRWLNAGEDFRSALFREFRHLDLPDPDEVLREDTEALRAREPSLRRTIRAQVTNGGYAAAAHLLSTLREILNGLPDLRSQIDFD